MYSYLTTNSENVSNYGKPQLIQIFAKPDKTGGANDI